MIAHIISPGLEENLKQLAVIAAALAIITGWLKIMARPIAKWFDARIKVATGPLAATLEKHTRELSDVRSEIAVARAESTEQHGHVQEQIANLTTRLDSHFTAHVGDGR